MDTPHDSPTVLLDLTTLREAPLDLLDPRDDQPRTQADQASVEALAAEFRKRGKLLQPIRVRLLDSGRFQIIAGERRYHAAKLVGWTHVPVVVDESGMDDATAFEDAVAENVHRQDLSAIELADSLRRIAVTRGFGVPPDTDPQHVRTKDIETSRLAEHVSLPEKTVRRHLRLLAAPPRLLDALKKHRTPYGTAEKLVALARRPGKGNLDKAVQSARRGATQRAAKAEASKGKVRAAVPRRLFAERPNGALSLRALRLEPNATSEDAERLLDAVDAFRAAVVLHMNSS